MTPEHAALLARIEAFDIDGGDVALPFVARLARENGWARPFAARVVREYRRYAFLAATAAEPVCPSEAVDAAWHLHLTYTRSYWKRFCGDVLGRPLHHDPTRGGPAEADKHRTMYARTLAAYRAAFGHEPPADVWTPADARFGTDLQHRVVNTAHNWVIPKRPIKRAARVAAAALVMAAFVPGCDGGLNPFDLKGTDFLGFLIPVLIAAVCVGRVVRSTMRAPDPQTGDDDIALTWEQAAYLAGGGPRLLSAAVARLVESGAAHVNGSKTRIDRGNPGMAAGLGPVEAAVYDQLPFGNTAAHLKPVQAAAEAAFADEAARLDADGFTLDAGRSAGVRFAAALPVLLVILLFGVPRLVGGLSGGKPAGYLVMTLLVGGFAGFVLCAAGPLRLTRRGDALLGRYRAKHAGMTEGAVTDAALGVALFGTAVLAGSTIPYLQKWYPRQTTSDSSGGCGSGCGSGDGGGGGCGGCGGGD